MTLSFKTKINGKPTYFAQKIIGGLLLKEFITFFDALRLIRKLEEKGVEITTIPVDKIHTIREDKKNRWKVGNKIHFVINNRTADRYQFAPVIPVISIQKIVIKSMSIDHQVVFIDGLRLTRREIDTLAKNDGFSSTQEFWDYFKYQDFEGKLIHWTNYKYNNH